MSINIPNHFVQQYKLNRSLLLQQLVSKLRGTVSEDSYMGKAASVVDQYGAIEMAKVTSRFAPKTRTDITTDRRWIYPEDWDLSQLVDSFDKLRLAMEPESAMVQAAAAAVGRRIDRTILSAVMGTAKTGETGATSTAYNTNNTVGVSIGGTNSLLNASKIKRVKKLARKNLLDLDAEELYMCITAEDEEALKKDPEFSSKEFSGAYDAINGRITRYDGVNFIYLEMVETVMTGTNKVNLPVWVKSGLHLGIWEEDKTSINQRHDLQGEPLEIYNHMTLGATRLEENRVFVIESYRS